MYSLTLIQAKFKQFKVYNVCVCLQQAKCYNKFGNDEHSLQSDDTTNNNQSNEATDCEVKQDSNIIS